ncbi:ATP-dependent helicase/nuclease subunit A [Pelagimonas phthalicica]|uniref:DNA 3'-5' helicase n=1 Tax=Pelagimonas phthalicica TaxID=1037362 RepID=A0A238J635_9RHOB|nr:double-strand break repair helicase AddA [Pelagimonas phthalicica]TDS95255.1 DNA helicase/exodeoxyribonuclease V subunit A [Pelagimonas phthalicica]SMX26221.1 ATP-dependent helicase/nuclease subunit A [Pelagimonas phthalicica]
MIRDDATQRQVDAASPGDSTWLAANAGSGKTRVLTDRVARLLLEGVLPEHILCLTYTKAAATEMQNRLFKRLGGWAMLNDDALRAELGTLGVESNLNADFLRDARTLFARAIETPGGLRIQTIHSFCSSLLRRFPLEAGVSPQFKEMEDRGAELLRAEILDRMSDGPQSHLVQNIAPFISGDDTESLLAEICRRREAFGGQTPDDIRAGYGIAPDMTLDTLLSEVFLGSEIPLLRGLVPLLRDSGKTDQNASVELARIKQPDHEALRILRAVCLTQAGTIRKNFPAKKLRLAASETCEAFDQLMARLERSLDIEKSLIAAQRDIALYAFAKAFLPAYEAEKTRRGWLDFDDLITRTRDLLSNEGVAAWVLYRLDGGIDHILVDEAQDTSPVQWQVIERLAQEFTSGEGARADVRRTIFVVGDKKQSIYSFQGADPSEFDRMRDEFRDRLQNTDAPLISMTLEHSFRSAEPILRLADNTFDGAISSGFTADQKHIAFKGQMPGRVDLWPLVDEVKDDPDGNWYEPLDRVGSTHHTVILANRIAHFIKTTIDAETPLPIEKGFSGDYEARPVHAGDFLILVRGRSRLFKEIIRACKKADLPIAGSDRLKVMSELAVRDILALLSYLATPEDDLSLATALRSPLFGLSEQQLFDLAHHRGQKFLWEYLRDRRDAYPDTMAILDDLRGQTDFLRPYDLIERILTRHNGRRLLMGRLGPEAEDGINALLGQALTYEQGSVPSLTGFLQWAQSDNLEIKRAPDSAGETLRVMTVHGSKGLEAPIVIMPDCADPNRTSRDVLLTDDQGAFWKQPSAAQPTRQRDGIAAQQEKERQERDRLLYVGLTRAEKWLVVAASGKIGKGEDIWYKQVARGMEASGAVDAEFDFGPYGTGKGQQLTHMDWSQLPLTRIEKPHRHSPDLPAIFSQPAPEPTPPVETRSPSDLGGAKALPGADGDSEEVAKTRGTLLHELLEHLAPLAPDQREAVGQGLINRMGNLSKTEGVSDILPQILAEAQSVLSAPDLTRFFAAGTLAEVPITADLPEIGRIHGVIDRLLVSDKKVIAVDFKSNRTIPSQVSDTPEGLLRQMGAYAAALTQVFPDHEIETGLLWTATAHYMPIPHEIVTQSLDRTPRP